MKGALEDANGVKRRNMWGKWDDSTFCEGPGGEHCQLWEKNPPAADPTRYNLTKFAIQLNELTEGMEGKLCPTDARLRPDQRLLEQGRCARWTPTSGGRTGRVDGTWDVG